ncbi:MAG: hypothetical protein IT372_25920 [Polyangiaceae bacterium]|nr:hypothetical protein [Polyangiaceae bacterium]
MIGFEFRETMAGSFHLDRDPADERPMSFTIRARAPRLRDFFRRPEVEIEGEIDAEGFADHRRLEGRLGLDVARTRTLPYAFHFTANDGLRYSFEGKKTLHAGDLVESMTVLPGRILETSGAPVGEALLRFDLRSDLLRFLRSFRVLR